MEEARSAVHNTECLLRALPAQHLGRRRYGMLQSCERALLTELGHFAYVVLFLFDMKIGTSSQFQLKLFVSNCEVILGCHCHVVST